LDKALTDSIVERIVKELPCKLIMISDSIDKDEDGNDNIYILVVTDSGYPKHQSGFVVYLAVKDVVKPKDTVILDSWEFERRSKEEGTYVKGIISSGEVVYRSK